MSQIKTLAEQIRQQMANPDTPEKIEKPVKKKDAKPPVIPQIVELLRDLDVSNNKTLIHARVDAQTAQLVHHLKTATGIEVTRLISYSISHLFETYPELKIIVKEHLQKFEI